MTVHASRVATTDHLRRAAVRATWGHSVHDTQPWRVGIDEAGLHLFADRARQLRVLDPLGRQLVISLGCALFNARVSLAAQGIGCEVARFPAGTDADIVASVRTPAHAVLDRALIDLDGLLDARHADQRLFFDDDVPPALRRRLDGVAAAEGATVRFVTSEADRAVVSAQSRRADDIENLNPAYRAEIRAWLFGGRSVHPGFGESHAVDACSSLALVCTDGDTPLDWLRAGEALQRMLLEIAMARFTARVLVQAIEVRSVRTQLRREVTPTSFPHLLLRIGRAPAAPMPRRRRLVDVLSEPD